MYAPFATKSKWGKVLVANGGIAHFHGGASKGGSPHKRFRMGNRAQIRASQIACPS